MLGHAFGPLLGLADIDEQRSASADARGTFGGGVSGDGGDHSFEEREQTHEATGPEGRLVM
jgi:hypothetical protein